MADVKRMQAEIDSLKYLLSKPASEIHKQYYDLQKDFNDQLDEAWSACAKAERDVERLQIKLKEAERVRLMQVVQTEKMRLLWQRFGTEMGWADALILEGGRDANA